MHGAGEIVCSCGLVTAPSRNYSLWRNELLKHLEFRHCGLWTKTLKLHPAVETERIVGLPFIGIGSRVELGNNFSSGIDSIKACLVGAEL